MGAGGSHHGGCLRAILAALFLSLPWLAGCSRDAANPAGADDGEILEANQVCAYFNYSNRLLNGLGVTTEGDTLGLSPPESADLAVAGYR